MTSVLLVLLLVLRLTDQGGAPAAASPSPSPAARTVFRVGVTAGPDSLNPFTGSNAVARELRQLQYDSLTQYSAQDFSAAPALAETWTTSPDGRTWTFTLHDGARWSDGEPLTSRDVAYTLDRVRRGAYERQVYGGYVADVARVDTPDPRTVVVTARRPTPVLLHLAIPILPEHVWAKVPERDVARYRNLPGAGGGVGSGPFTVRESSSGRVVLERNREYWGDPPAVDEVVFQVYPSGAALAGALRDGQVDFANGLPADAFRSLTAAPDVRQVAAASPTYHAITVNTGAALRDGTPFGTGHPALRDARVRRALARAVDREGLVRRVAGDHGAPGDSVIPPVYPNLHWTPGEEDTLGYDPAAARFELDAAGYLAGPDGIRRTPLTGEPLRFRLFARAGSPESATTVALVGAGLSAVGIAVRSATLPEPELARRVARGDFDLVESGAVVVEPDPDSQLARFTCANRPTALDPTAARELTDSYFCDRRYDALYVKQGREIEPSERARTVKAMQQELYGSVASVVTSYDDDLQAYRADRFTDYVAQPQGDGRLLFQQGTWSYLSIRPVTGGQPVGGVTDAASTARWYVLGGAALALLGGTAAVVVLRRRREQPEVPPVGVRSGQRGS